LPVDYPRTEALIIADVNAAITRGDQGTIVILAAVVEREPPTLHNKR
jgi:hypothetical protein